MKAAEVHVARFNGLSTIISDYHASERGQIERLAFTEMVRPFRLAQTADDTLLLVRGTPGSRSLFYAMREDSSIGVSGDALTLAQWRGIPSADRSKLSEFVRDEEIADERTYFEGVQRVLPGERVRIDRTGSVSKDWWWRPPTAFDPTPLGHVVEEISRLLHENIALYANLPLGLMLSSGMDSSILAVLMSDARIDDVQAYCGAPIRQHDLGAPLIADESMLAHKTAQMLGLPFTRVEAPVGSLLARHRSVLATLHQPFANLANLPWMDALVAKAADDGRKVLLEGGLGNVVVSHHGQNALRSAVRDGRWKAAREHWQRRRQGGEGTGLMCIARGLFDRLLGRPGVRDQLLDNIRTLDNAPYAAAFEARHGVSMVDPMADRRLIEQAIGLGEDVFVAGGQPRAVAQRILDGNVPEPVAQGRIGGIQGADWRDRLRASANDLWPLLNRTPAMAQEIGIDVALLEREARKAMQYEGPETIEDIQESWRLLRPLAALDFCDWVEGGCQ